MRTFIALLFLQTMAPAATLIQGYTPATNDRFAGSAQLFADQFDLSGVGRSSSGRWATLITPNIFVTARHYSPAVGQGVTFFATNDPDGSSFTYEIAGLSRIQNSDLTIGHFAEAVDPRISHYDWHANALSYGSFSTSLAGSPVLQFGISPSNSLYTSTTNAAVGQNRAEFFLNNLSVPNLGTGDFIVTSYSNPSAADALDYEARINSGDSGSPLLLQNGDSLSLLGVATAKSSSSSYFTYTGTSSPDVESYIDTYGLVPVPEPSVSLLLPAALLLMRRHRRAG